MSPPSRQKVSAVTYFLGSLFFISCVCCIGGALNDGRIYRRFRSNACRTPGGVYEISIPHSELCCQVGSYHADDWVCVAAYDNTERILTQLCWVAPIFPLVISLLNDMIFKKPSTSLQFKRICFCVVLFVYRTFVLYFAFGAFQDYAQQGTPNESCWYHSLIGRCEGGFDFSDHVVMLLCHYCFPISMELANWNNSAGLYHGGKMHRTIQGLSVSFSFIMAAFVSRTVFFTSIYFHTPFETFIGVFVVTVFLYFPVVYLSNHFLFLKDILYLEK